MKAMKPTLDEKIIRQFGNKMRLRVCGICIEQNKVLLVNHRGLNSKGVFWAPPGGGMEYGASAPENLKREIKEETGLDVEVENFLFIHEYLNKPLHAVELFFSVKRLSGELGKGIDPEMKPNEQIIQDVRFIDFSEVVRIEKSSLHQLFHRTDAIEKIHERSGYFLTENFNVIQAAGKQVTEIPKACRSI